MSSPSTSAQFSWVHSLHRRQCTQSLSIQDAQARHFLPSTVSSSSHHFFYWLAVWSLTFFNTWLASFLSSKAPEATTSLSALALLLCAACHQKVVTVSAVWWSLLLDGVRSQSLHLQRFDPCKLRTVRHFIRQLLSVPLRIPHFTSITDDYYILPAYLLSLLHLWEISISLAKSYANFEGSFMTKALNSCTVF